MFKKRTIEDDLKLFYDKEFSTAIAIMGYYLVVWFEQIFNSPEYKRYFEGWANPPKYMSGACIGYLLGVEPDLNKDEHYNLAQFHVPEMG